MPPKMDPLDWERLFERRQRRRGPLAVLLIAVIMGMLVLGGIGLTPFLINQIEASRVVARQTQLALQTREARATAQQAATQRAIQTATAMPTPTATVTTLPTNTPEPIIGRAQVIRGGNIRSEPRIAPETVIGQVCIGDRVELLEERQIDRNNRWYRLRVTETSTTCDPTRVSVGTQGWVSTLLLSSPER
ncbi:MAG: SH3 domain-containing protein [Chloroflexus sp.]